MGASSPNGIGASDVQVPDGEVILLTAFVVRAVSHTTKDVEVQWQSGRSHNARSLSGTGYPPSKPRLRLAAGR